MTSWEKQLKDLIKAATVEKNEAEKGLEKYPKNLMYLRQLREAKKSLDRYQDALELAQETQS